MVIAFDIVKTNCKMGCFQWILVSVANTDLGVMLKTPESCLKNMYQTAAGYDSPFDVSNYYKRWSPSVSMPPSLHPQFIQGRGINEITVSKVLLRATCSFKRYIFTTSVPLEVAMMP